MIENIGEYASRKAFLHMADENLGGPCFLESIRVIQSQSLTKIIPFDPVTCTSGTLS